MAPTRRVAILVTCSAIILAVVASGPGTVALLSDTHVATGNISADADGDRTTTVEAVDESENATGNVSAGNASVGVDAADGNASAGNTSTGNASVGNSDAATSHDGVSPNGTVESGNEAAERSQ
ncbi:hypothetical protein ACFQDG_09850 [Natronoarchaeum mannanilyticum]|uniref:Uncharacterized protein n=1 Tax=Natronoarchaeum mannanilyticum TaxID=926360 RepID=A0AAV3T8L4_9EURY